MKIVLTLIFISTFNNVYAGEIIPDTTAFNDELTQAAETIKSASTQARDDLAWLLDVRDREDLRDLYEAYKASRKELAELYAQLGLAKAGQAASIAVGVTTVTMGLVNSLHARVGSELLEQTTRLGSVVTPNSLTVIDKGLMSAKNFLNRYGKKYPKIILGTAVASGALTARWYYLESKEVSRFQEQIKIARKQLDALIADIDLLLKEPAT